LIKGNRVKLNEMPYETQLEFFSDGDTRALIIFADIGSPKPSLEMLEA